MCAPDDVERCADGGDGTDDGNDDAGTKGHTTPALACTTIDVWCNVFFPMQDQDRHEFIGWSTPEQEER